nr:phosphonoacetaldehyde hydrolase [uncultured Hyphomonas sp.]
MSVISTVIFDWAGTIVDFGSRAPVAAMKRVFEDAGMRVSEAQIRKYMGLAKRDHVIAMLSAPEGQSAWHSANQRDWNESDVDHLLTHLTPAMAMSAVECSELISGAREMIDWLVVRGIRIGSTTGYNRAMMTDILPLAAKQGYTPEVIICAGETSLGRPAPLMIWKVLETLESWPVHSCLKVDDAPVGIEAGVNAGVWTVGVAGSGNGVGMSQDEFSRLTPQEKAAAMAPAAKEFERAGADFVVESVADISGTIERIDRLLLEGERPGRRPCESFV